MSLNNTPITGSEIDTLKHTLGLNNGHTRHKEPYRNYYCTPQGGDPRINSLCERGFMRERCEGSYTVTPDGIHFLEDVLGIRFIHEPKQEEWQTLPQERREHFTAMQSTIYCPHCGTFFHDDNPYEDIAAEFGYEDALCRPEKNATLEYDRTCKECGKRYHLSVDATVELHFTTTCETEEDTQ
ncbi:MAG: hypothetical protein LBQ15_11045 [Clostridium sp.]|nr:hypothetical protein [Clostridium sp.]